MVYGIILIVVVIFIPEGIINFVKQIIERRYNPIKMRLKKTDGELSSAILPKTDFNSSVAEEDIDQFFALDTITKKFGGLVALNNVSFDVKRGEIVGLIGPNGAGKTTLFNIISGELKPDHGKVFFKDKMMTEFGKSYAFCRSGIGRTFQIVKPLPQMTVLQNVMVGILRKESNFIKAKERSKEILEIVGLKQYENLYPTAMTLAGKKRLEVARALSSGPELLLLDEIMAGLNPKEVEGAIALIKRISASGITVILIEHVIKGVMQLADRIVVLDYGRKLAEGTPAEVMKNEEVVNAYLGGYMTESGALC
jgi:ABC-type branched-subunit amino acid transport system ATPase component